MAVMISGLMHFERALQNKEQENEEVCMAELIKFSHEFADFIEDHGFPEHKITDSEFLSLTMAIFCYKAIKLRPAQ